MKSRLDILLDALDELERYVIDLRAEIDLRTVRPEAVVAEPICGASVMDSTGPVVTTWPCLRSPGHDGECRPDLDREPDEIRRRPGPLFEAPPEPDEIRSRPFGLVDDPTPPIVYPIR